MQTTRVPEMPEARATKSQHPEQIVADAQIKTQRKKKTPHKAPFESHMSSCNGVLRQVDLGSQGPHHPQIVATSHLSQD
eukprot:7631355-Ditylum_brightwellii.AAC.1